ncbi:60S acidic ribosomal protein P2 [Novymonas esmeraldas]|uniref:60S acidic ribosomal protein P2 n=1 Tax=Novymonas esmeraldas TaxID=1808958 RepID=A0AAW0EQI1_9TRYP
MSAESLACTYAALMLSDAGLPTSAENISAAVKAAGVQVRPTLPIVFARFLEKKSVESLMATAAAQAPSASAAAPAAGAAAAPAAAAAGKAEDKKKKDEPEEEGDDDMGFGLFD